MMVDKIESAESSASSAMKMATLAGLEASDKQDRLVSGSNIKTICGNSILGSGNITPDPSMKVYIPMGGTLYSYYKSDNKSFYRRVRDGGNWVNSWRAIAVTASSNKEVVLLGVSYNTTQGCRILISGFQEEDITDKYECVLLEDGSVSSVTKVEGESGGSSITVDSEVSETSENPVQNKAIKAYVDEQVAKAGGGSSVDVDTELSNMSTNPVQNKVITNAINAKADNTRVDLISERLDDIDGEMKDFATESQLNNKQDVITDLDTIRQGAAKGATALQSIPSEYVTESELNSKGYATTSQVNAKQDSITDLGEIRRGAGLGATALQSVPSEYITEAELNAKNYATATQLTAKQDTISDIAAIREGASKGMTALQSYKEGGLEYIAVDGLMDKDGAYWFLPGVNDDDPAHTFAMLSDLQNAGGVSQEDFDALYDGVVEAEEVTAAALNDLNDKLGKLAENAQGETVTKEEFETAVNNLNESLSGKADARTTSEALTALSGQVETLSGLVETAVTSEQLSSAVDTVNNTILENEEVTAAALNDLDQRSKDLSVLVEQNVTKEEVVKLENDWNAATLDNEEIISTALVDLDNRIKAIMSRLEALENI